MAKNLRDVGLPLAKPLVGYFDRRFQDMHDRLDQRIDALAAKVSTEVECVSEMTLGMQRFVDLCERRVDDTLAAVADLVATFEDRNAANAAAPRPDPSLLEIPFAVAGLADAAFAGRVVLAGQGGTSNLALLLAYLGHSVTVVGADLPVTHPEVTTVSTPVADWEGPAEPVDAILALPLDPADLDQFKQWLAPKGQLVLSASVGHQALDELLSDWDVVERRFYRWVDARWEPQTESSSGEGTSLLLLRAAPRA